MAIQINIIEKPFIPPVIRISAGGFPGVGYYLVYRGDKKDIIECLEEVTRALKEEDVEIIQENDNNGPQEEYEENCSGHGQET